MQTSLNISSVNSQNKKITKSLTYIDESATNEQLETAAQKFNAISQNSYVDADRIIKMSVTEPYTPPAKNEPILTVDSNGAITYNGDGTLYIKNETEVNNIFLNLYNNQLTARNAAGNTPTSYSCTIYASAGTNYAAKSIEFTYGG